MAGLNLTLKAGLAPAQAALPGNLQALLNVVAAYVLIAGGQNFNGINFGASTPAPANRGIPWFKTDQFGNPIGLFAWNGIAWASIPTVAASGPSSGRPSNPAVGTEYYDITIGALLIFSSGGWTTATGSVGDVKEVKAADIATALQSNPGWAQDTASIGLVVGGAGGATSITAAHPYGQIIGEEAHVIGINEMPAHTHTVSANQGDMQADGNVAHAGGILSDHQATATGSTGGNAAANVIQPTIYYWRIVKQF